MSKQRMMFGTLLDWDRVKFFDSESDWYLLLNSNDTISRSWVRQKFFIPLSFFITPPASITD